MVRSTLSAEESTVHQEKKTMLNPHMYFADTRGKVLERPWESCADGDTQPSRDGNMNTYHSQCAISNLPHAQH